LDLRVRVLEASKREKGKVAMEVMSEDLHTNVHVIFVRGVLMWEHLESC